MPALNKPQKRILIAFFIQTASLAHSDWETSLCAGKVWKGFNMMDKVVFGQYIMYSEDYEQIFTLHVF